MIESIQSVLEQVTLFDYIYVVLTILFMPKGIGGFIDKYFIDRRFKKKQAVADK